MIGLGLGINKISYLSEGYLNNYSLLLDGVDEYVNLDTLGSNVGTNTTGTIAMWVKPVDATPATNQFLFGFCENLGAAIDSVSFANTTAGKLNAFCQIGGSVQWTLETDSAVFSDNTWTHIAITQNGTAPVLYVNATAVAQTFTTSTDKTTWFNGLVLDFMTIGCFRRSTNSLFFNGNVDEFHYWNSALTASEITAIYNSGTPKDLTTDFGNYASSADLVSRYRFGDDPSDVFSTQWTLNDSVNNYDAVTVNCEEADVELDTP